MWEFDVLLCIDAPKDEPFFALHNSLSDSTKWIRQPITSSPVGGGFAMQPFFFFGMAKAHGDQFSRKISEAAAWDPNSQRPGMGPPSCAKSWTEALHHVHHVLAVDHVVIFEPL